MRYFLRTTDQSAAEDVVIIVEDEKFLLGDCHVFRAVAASFFKEGMLFNWSNGISMYDFVE